MEGECRISDTTIEMDPILRQVACSKEEHATLFSC